MRRIALKDGKISEWNEYGTYIYGTSCQTEGQRSSALLHSAWKDGIWVSGSSPYEASAGFLRSASNGGSVGQPRSGSVGQQVGKC